VNPQIAVTNRYEGGTVMTRQYTRDDIDFETWYSPWMKLLARSYTAEELQAKLHDAEAQARVRQRTAFALSGTRIR